MKILIIGSGGREHALAWKAAQSPLVKVVYIAPGNGGTAMDPRLQNIPINDTDIFALLNFAKNEKIDLTIVGPEAPLVFGIVDIFRSANLKIFGPTKKAAQLESSKSFAKKFLNRYRIPTTNYRIFTEAKSAITYLYKKNMPIVIKADGLAAGKGVIIAKNIKEAEDAVKKIMIEKIFGDAGRCVIIEDFLDGREVSFTVIVNGEDILPMPTSRDYKCVGDGNIGPNTGGMGVYSPNPIVTDKVYQRIMNNIIWPTIKGMMIEDNTYTGFLYVGLIIDRQENPVVIEFNCRFGDPEAQSIMLRMKSDIIELCLIACEDNGLKKYNLELDKRISLGIVIATIGYPGNYNIGSEIYGLPSEEIDGAKIFHGGTFLTKDNKLLTNSGRVLCVTALGKTLAEARYRATTLVKNIHWDGSFSRKDIGCHDSM